MPESPVLAGYEKPMFEELLPFNNGALGSRIRRRFALPDFSDDELINLLEMRLGLTKPSYRLSDSRYAPPRVASERPHASAHNGASRSSPRRYARVHSKGCRALFSSAARSKARLTSRHSPSYSP